MSASRSFDHGRTRRNFAFTDEVVDLGEEPFDVLAAREQDFELELEQQEQHAADAADATADAIWARSVDYR